jgi:hypothetical protein
MHAGTSLQRAAARRSRLPSGVLRSSSLKALPVVPTSIYEATNHPVEPIVSQLLRAWATALGVFLTTGRFTTGHRGSGPPSDIAPSD